MPTDPAPGFSEARDEQLINSWSCKQILPIFMPKWHVRMLDIPQHHINNIYFHSVYNISCTRILGTIKINIFCSKIN